MKIALTGGTGFLGRYLIRHLAGAGHSLRCWHRPTSDRSGLADVSVEWLEGSLGEPAASAALVKGADALVHAAVQWQGPGNRQGEKQGDIQPFLHANLMGSLLLFQAARQAGVARVVFISSCAVHDVILHDRPLDETHPLWASNHYGALKGAIEKFVHSYGFGQDWAICALRPTGIYGLDHPAHCSRWFDLVGQVLRGEAVATAKGGKEVHAGDVARAVHLLLHADAR